MLKSQSGSHLLNKNSWHRAMPSCVQSPEKQESFGNVLV